MPERTIPEGWPRDVSLTYERISYARDCAAGLKLTRWGRELGRDLDAICGTLDDALEGYSKLAERLRSERAAMESDNRKAAAGVPSDLSVIEITEKEHERSKSHVVRFNRPVERWEFVAWLKAAHWFGFPPEGYSGGADVDGNTGTYHHFNTSD